MRETCKESKSRRSNTKKQGGCVDRQSVNLYYCYDKTVAVDDSPPIPRSSEGAPISLHSFCIITVAVDTHHALGQLTIKRR
eukprot:1865090-Amphidinium_carterae.1